MDRRAQRESTTGTDAAIVNPRVFRMFSEAITFKQDGVNRLEHELGVLEDATVGQC